MGVRQRYRNLRGSLRIAGDLILRAVRPPDWTGVVSTYGEPNTERLLPVYEQYALHGYGGNGPVFSVIDTRRRLFSEARFKWRRLSDKKLFGDQALGLLEKPWPNGATGDLLARMEIDVSLAGNAYVRNAGDRLERLRPDWVTIVSWVRDGVSPGQETADGRPIREVVGYLYEPIGDPDREIEFFPEDEVAHWAPVLDPLANWRGMSWLTPVLQEINADRAMTEHKDTFFRNAATPNLILKYAQKLQPTSRTDIVNAIAARHAGPGNAGGTLVLDQGADPMVVGAKFADAQFAELQAAGENRIAVAGGVPAIVVGLKEGLDAAAWSMYRQAMRAFADLTMRSNWRSACAALSKVVAVPAGAELWFDTSDISALQEGEQESAATLQTQAATASTLISAGYTPDSVVTALTAGDLTLLKHTGLFSVQLRPPGADAPPTEPAGDDEPDELVDEHDEDGSDDDQVDPDALRAALWWLLRGWNPALHPRDERGRFRALISADLLDAVDVTKLSERRLFDLFGQFSKEEPLNEGALLRLSNELERRDRDAAARREGNPLAQLNLATLTEDELHDLWSKYKHREDVWQPVTAELAERRRRQQRTNDQPLIDWSDHGADTLEQRRIDKAVAAGADYRDAYADAYALSREDLLREDRRALVDLERRAGETRRQAVRRAYAEHVHLQYLAAEQATRGHLLTREGQAAGVDAISLFSGPRTRARKWASEDLRRWWEENPRVTYTEFAQQVLGGDRADLQQLRQAGNDRDFGV